MSEKEFATGDPTPAGVRGGTVADGVWNGVKPVGDIRPELPAGGETVLITGASSGIGAEFACQLARDGRCKALWLVARRAEAMTAVAEAVRREAEADGRAFPQCRVLALDLCKAEDLARLQAALAAEKPALGWLVNAAGFGKFGSWEAVGADWAGRMIDLNVKAVVRITEMCLPYMAAGGRIVEIASTAAFCPLPGMNVYAASKSFVLFYGRALRQELRMAGRGVSLTVLCPGPVRTAFWDIGNETYALKRLGRPDAFWMTEAGDVVRHTLRAACKGKAVVTYGFWNGWHRRLAKCLPWSWIMAFSRKLI
ncbi:MAG: SDR family NAD(P)-dependent oxidoreductase [Bacteroidales bacterium]|nr:SDR family NAD(P)-dependent oxidoreductase [Bacteroidales bacterium]